MPIIVAISQEQQCDSRHLAWLLSGSTSRIAFISSVLHQAGTALMYDLRDPAKPFLLSTFSGDRRFSRFGGDVHLRDLNNDGLGKNGSLIISIIFHL